MDFRFTVMHRREAQGTSPLVLHDPLLVVIGFAGRDEEAVQRHVAELQKLGVPAPARVPSLYTLPNWLLLVEPPRVQVSTTMTSGEVEPVLIRMPSGEVFLTVGSDHTDRDLERLSFGASKAACPKVVAREVWSFEDIEGRWDNLRLQSVAGDETAFYQDASVTALRDPRSLLAEVDARLDVRNRPLVAFLGTVPTLEEELRYASQFTAAIRDGERWLACSYQVEEIDPLEASMSALIPGGPGAPVQQLGEHDAHR